MLNPTLQRQVRKALEHLPTPVTLAVFTRSDGDPHACEICDDTRQLAEEVAWLSDGRVTTKIYDLAHDEVPARAFGIEAVPAVVPLDANGTDHGIRFFGSPTGYELGTLIGDIQMISRGDAGLRAGTLSRLGALTTPLHIQVFVTPTCPYCPQAVSLAHRLAFASDRVTASMFDAAEFPDLADRYDVHAVPLTVINDVVRIEGAVPESRLAAELRNLPAEGATA